MSFLRKFRLGAVAATLPLVFLPACASDVDTTGEMVAVEPNPDATLIEKVPEAAVDKVLEDVDAAKAAEPASSASSAAEPHVGDEISHNTTEKIPLEINADVERWIEFFTVKDPERMRRFLERGEKYKEVVTAVLRDQGIPTEIYYQALIESGFATHATSSARAVGIWQFIPQTGKRYGLRVDTYVDERRDPMRATIAASLYLKDLYNVFQSWYLAMAAYNAGEGRIMSAIMRSKTRDFWEMVRTKALPAETMNYIPKFLAATIIGHNPKRYGLDDLRPELAPPLQSVSIPSPIRLADVATATGVALETLKTFNPHILRGVTPPDVSTYRIWVPKDQVVAVEGSLEKLASLRLRGASKKLAIAAADSGPASGYGGAFHVVKKGDTAARVASQHGLTIAKLKSLNGLRSNRLVIGARLLVEPAMQEAAAAFKKYRVRHGDNLDAIARRFKMSVDDLKKVNRLKKNRVYAGQMLKVSTGNG